MGCIGLQSVMRFFTLLFFEQQMQERYHSFSECRESKDFFISYLNKTLTMKKYVQNLASR